MSEELVGAHESSDAFLSYRETLGPLVRGEGVIRVNTVPFAVEGYDALQTDGQD